jgi:hypothetical protein
MDEAKTLYLNNYKGILEQQQEAIKNQNELIKNQATIINGLYGNFIQKKDTLKNIGNH